MSAADQARAVPLAAALEQVIVTVLPLVNRIFSRAFSGIPDQIALSSNAGAGEY
jgi:hypothetical protein